MFKRILQVATFLATFLALGQVAHSQPSQMTFYNGVYYDAGATTPGSCSSPAFFYNTGNSTAYRCVNGSFTSEGGGTTVTLKTNGTTNGSQTVLNLKNGTNITITDDGVGGITITGPATPTTATTQADGDSSTKFGTDAFVQKQLPSIATQSPNADGTTDDSTALTNACTAYPGGFQLTPNKAYAVGTNLTLTCPVYSLSPPAGGALLVKNTFTLTLNGTFYGALVQQIGLTGTGTVVFGPATPSLYPEWLGALRDNSHDDLAAINTVIAARSTGGGGIVQLQAGTYKTTGAIIEKSGVTIQGVAPLGVGGASSPTIINDTSTSGDIISIVGTTTDCAGATSINNPVVRNLQIQRTPVGVAGSVGINTTDACWILIDHVSAKDSFVNFKLNSARSGTWDTLISNWTTTSASVRSGWEIDTTTAGSFTTYLLHCLAVGTGSNTRGLYVHGTHTSDIKTDHFESATLDYGFYIDSTIAIDMHFVNSIHDGCQVDCIFLNGNTGYPGSIEITGGYVAPTTGNNGIHNTNSRGVVVSNVQFLYGNGLLLDGSGGAAYSSYNNNVFRVPGGKTGAHFSGSCAGNTFNNNVMIGDPTATVLLSVTNTCILNEFNSNSFGGTATTGMNFDATSNQNTVHSNSMIPGSITIPIADASSGNDYGVYYTADESTGANNALVATQIGLPLIKGLGLSIKLAHSLQAGSNTLAYASGSALAIKSARNPANNIGTAYVSGGIINLRYDGTQWLDLSQ